MNFRKMAVAFAIALAVSGLCTLSLGRKLTASAAEHKVRHHYVVPTRPLQADEVLKADSVAQSDWYGDDVPGAFEKPTDLVGRTVLYPVDKGQLLTEKMVSAPGAGVGLAGKIPDGMRAVALRTDEVIGVAGFLVPGCRLDVLATYRVGNAPEPATVTVLQNAEVIAVGHQTNPDPQADGKAAKDVTVVTLLLSPEDAKKAVMASTSGTIHFVMRGGADNKPSVGGPVDLSQLTGAPFPGAQSPAPGAAKAPATPRVAKPKAPKPEPKIYTVQTILGDKEVTNTFQVAQ